MGLRLSRPLLLLLSGIALVGCSAAASSSTPGSSTTTTISNVVTYAKNGTVSVAVSRLPAELNPLTPAGANSVTAMVMADVWPQVYVVGDHPQACAEGGPQCLSVISSAQVENLSPLTVTYVVAPGARWSDGVPITSSDFIYEWQQELTVGPTLPATNPTIGYQEIKSISPPDATTFNVTFSTPYADWKALFSPLVPSHIAASSTAGWTTAFAANPPRSAHGNAVVTAPVSSSLVSGGPFELGSETFRGRTPISLTLVRNPHYWGLAAHMAKITFVVEPTEAATLNALRNDVVQLAELPPGPAIDSLVASDPLLSESTSASPTIEQLVFNLADPTLVPAVRQAIADSIDRHQLFTNTVGLSTGQGGVSGNRLFLVGATGSQSNDGQYETPDLDEADTLLESAGYTVDTQGVVRSASGTPFVLTLTGPTDDPVANAVEQQLQAQLIQVGIRLEIDNVAEKQLLGTTLPDGAYQLALAPYRLSPYLSTESAFYDAPVHPVPSTTGAASAIPSVKSPVTAASEPGAVVAGSVTRDINSYEDSKVTSLFGEAAAELNATADEGLYNEIDTTLWLDMPTLPLFDVPVTLVSRVDVVGVSMSPTWAGPFWDAQNWAIQTNPPPTTTTSTTVVAGS